MWPMSRAVPVALLLGLCLVGCATVTLAPPEESARALQLAVPEGKALVYVFCPRWDAPGVGFTPLYANQEFVGGILEDAFYVLESGPGELRLDFPFMTFDTPTTLKLKVEAGRRYYVRHAVERSYFPSRYVPMLTLVNDEVGAASLGSLVRVVHIRPPPDQDRLARERKTARDRALVVVFCNRWLEENFHADIQVNHRLVGQLGARSFLVAEVVPGKVTITATAKTQETLVIDLGPGATAYVELPGPDLVSSGLEPRQVSEHRGNAAVSELRLASPVAALESAPPTETAGPEAAPSPVGGPEATSAAGTALEKEAQRPSASVQKPEEKLTVGRVAGQVALGALGIGLLEGMFYLYSSVLAGSPQSGWAFIALSPIAAGSGSDDNAPASLGFVGGVIGLSLYNVIELRKSEYTHKQRFQRNMVGLHVAMALGAGAQAIWGPKAANGDSPVSVGLGVGDEGPTLAVGGRF